MRLRAAIPLALAAYGSWRRLSPETKSRIKSSIPGMRRSRTA